MRGTTRTQRNVLLAVCALLLACVLGVGLMAGIPRASADDLPFIDYEEAQSIKEECKKFTDSDKIEGVDMTLQEFTRKLKEGYYVSGAGVVSTPEQFEILYELDACLRGLIPERILARDGHYTYMGREYSFSIETEISTLIQTHTADVIFVNHMYDYNEKNGEVTMKVEVTTRKFAFRVNKPDLCWEDVGKLENPYYVRNLDLACYISNEHLLNSYDEGYDKRTDEGVILRQVRYNYGGILGYDDSFDIKPIAEYIAKKAWGKVAGYFPTLAAISKVINTAQSTVDLIVDYIDNEPYVLESNAEDNIFTEQSKASQQNDPNVSALSKAAAISPDVENEFFVYDYAEAKFLLHDTCAETHCYLVAKYDIVKKEHDGELKTLNISTRVVADERVLFEKTDEAHEGENAGYNRSPSSEQVFAFTPDKTGQYTISVSDGLVKYSETEIGNAEYTESKILAKFIAGTTYYIAVTGVTTRKYTLNVDFTPQELTQGTHTISIPDSDPVYYSLHTDVPQALNLALNGAQDVVVSLYKHEQLIGTLAKDTMQGFIIDGDVLVKIENLSGGANSCTLKAEWAPELDVNAPYIVSKFTNAYFSVVPTWSATYLLEIESGMLTANVRLYDDTLTELMQYDSNSPSFALAENKQYYVKIEYGSVYTVNMRATLKLLPDTLTLNQQEIEQTTQKHMYLSAAVNCEGYYILQGNGLDITVFDTNLQPISQPHNGGARAYLEQGKRYYIQTEGGAGSYTFTANVESTTQLSGTLNDKGNILIQFCPKVSAQYQVTGVATYAWYTTNLVQTSTLQAGNLYYARIEGVPNAAYSIAIELIASQLYAGRLYGVGSNGLYKLDIGANAHIRTYCTSGVSSEFRLCDETLAEVKRGTADSAPQYLDLPQGTYYLYVNISGGTSVMFELIDDTTPQSIIVCGVPARFELGNTPEYYTFACKRSGTYWLRFTAVEFEYNLSVIEANSSRTVQVSEPTSKALEGDAFTIRVAYSMELLAGETYVLSISTNFKKVTGSLVFGFPARLQQLRLGDIPLNIEPNSVQEINVAMGKSYEFTWAYNQGVTLDDFNWNIQNGSNPNEILTKDNNTLRVGFDPEQYNKKASIMYKDDVYTFTLVMVLKYPVQATIALDADYRLTVGLQDETGAPFKDTEVVQKTGLKKQDGTLLKEFTSNYIDTATWLIFESMNMYAVVNLFVDGREYTYTTDTITYPVHITSMANYNQSQYDKIRRLVLDARKESGALNKSIEIPQSVTHLFVLGKSTTTYKGLYLDLRNVTYLYMENFTAENSAIRMRADSTQFICSGEVSISTQVHDEVIYARNLSIYIGKSLKILAQKRAVGDRKQGIIGLSCSALTVDGKSGSSITVRGGDGGDGVGSSEKGGDGGYGIVCYSMMLSNCSYTFMGGNGGLGGNGANGANSSVSTGGAGVTGGLGGNGASQIVATMYALGIHETPMGSRGGDGGNGGAGGNGANGTSSDLNGKDGGRGGNGGDGGMGARYIQASNFNTAFASDGRQGNGGRGGNGGNGSNGHNDSSTSDNASAGGNGGNGGAGGIGYLSGQMGNGGNGGHGGSVGKYGNGKNGGHGGHGYRGGNGGNGSAGRMLGKNGGDGGNGGDSIIKRNAWECAEQAEPGKGGAGGAKATGGKTGSPGSNGTTKWVD
ncbi:MAG: hypothetical protein HFE47_07810 [Clostridia bacterium]|nr:hypothetical protein [Clostridia bacterium]